MVARTVTVASCDLLGRTGNTIASMRKRSELDNLMDIKPIKTQRDYEVALGAIEALMTAKRGTPEGDQLDVMTTLVEAYEARHFPLDLPDPVEAIKYVMEQRVSPSRTWCPTSDSSIASMRS